MAAELQCTVVIEMPQSMYDYLAPLAQDINLTMGEMLISALLANCLTSASQNGLMSEVNRVLDLWINWGVYPDNGLQAVIIS